MTTANLSRAETTARARTVSRVTYAVHLDLRSAADPAVTGFETVTTITFDATEPTTWLDFLGERVDAVEVNGAEVDVAHDGARIALTNLAEHNVVVVRAVGTYSRSGEGLHRFVDPADGMTYLYTQYEPADARRVFACFEQPNLKAPFTFEVAAPEGWTVLSNERPQSRVDGTVVFAPTRPISTYLTAIIAGPYHRAESRYTRGDSVIELGAYCRASLAPHLDADAVFDVTRAGLDFFQGAFDYPYPWGKYDQVFVPEYNLGAMENPGCVTFTESYVFRSAATRSQYARRANTILHEMAHMWFGDLVTMEWWDDLWLKESFADYMGAFASVAATEYTDAWVSFANRRKAWAYLQDQLPTTHPIVADIVDLEAAKLNFDGITYAKGASVLKQLAAFVGEDAFFAGARAYFRTHEYGNTTLRDLLVALSAAADRPLDDWSDAWLRTSGVTTLSYDRASGTVTQSDPRPQRLDIACLEADAEGHLVDRSPRTVHLTDRETPLDLPDAAIVLLNDGDHTYAKVRLDARSLDTVRTSLDRVPDDLRRGLIWSSLWNSTRDGELPAAEYVELVRRFAPTESHEGILGAILSDAAVAVERYSVDRDALRTAWTDAAYRNTIAATPGSDAQLEWFRAFAAAASHCDDREADVRALLTGRGLDGLTMDAEQRWSLWFASAATGHATDAELAEFAATDRTAAGAVHHLAARAARPTAERKAQVWAALTSDRDRESSSNDEIAALTTGFTAGRSRESISSYDVAYFASLEDLWRTRSIEIARRLVIGLYPQTDDLGLVDGWLAAHPDAPAALRRLVIEQRDHLARSLRARAVVRGSAQA